MSLPYADYPASTATVDAFTGEVLSYEAAGELATSGTVAGEVLSVAAEAAVAAVAAEPLLIIGASVAAAVAVDALFDKFAPTRPKPKLDTNRRTAGRVGGGVSVNFKFKLVNQAETISSASGNAPFQGIGTQGFDAGQVAVGLVFAGILYGAYQSLPTQVEEPLTILDVTATGGQPNTDRQAPLQWEVPGNGILPVPTPVDLTYAPGGTITVTPTVYPTQKSQPGQHPGQKTPPGVMVRVPEAGMTIVFNPTSIVISYEVPSESQFVAAPPININTKISYPEDPCHCHDNRPDEILCRVKRLQKDLLKDGYQYAFHPGVSGQGGKQDTGTDELVDVEVNITSFPITERTQPAAPDTPTVYFIGWFSWLVGGHPGERIAISYLQTCFLAPPNANGYMFSLHEGCSANSDYYTRTPKPYVDNCA